MSTTHRGATRVLPRHFVSARHGTQHRNPATGATSWRPYGVQHARGVGSPLTACGLNALEWPMFWEMAFPRNTVQSCEECMVAIRFADRERPRFMDLAGAAPGALP